MRLRFGQIKAYQRNEQSLVHKVCGTPVMNALLSYGRGSQLTCCCCCWALRLSLSSQQVTWCLRGISCSGVTARVGNAFFNNTLAKAVQQDFREAIRADGWPAAVQRSVAVVRQPCRDILVGSCINSDTALRQCCACLSRQCLCELATSDLN